MSAKYIELIDGSIYNRGVIIPVDTYKSVRREHACYLSMFCFEEDIVEHVKGVQEVEGKPSVTGFAGKCFMNYLWIDIDTPNETGNILEHIGDTIVETKKIVENIQIKYDLKEEHLVVYFSGNKGFHIGISSVLFGAERFSSETIPSIAKTLARIMTDNSKMVDYNIYNTTRILRAPMSKHEKTGHYKVRIDIRDLERQDIAGIAEKSKNCTNYHGKISNERKDVLVKLFDQCLTKSKVDLDLMSGVVHEKNTFASNASLFRVPSKGERNHAIFKQAIRLFGGTTLKNNEVIDLLRLVATACNHQAVVGGYDEMPEKELRALINSAFKNTRAKNDTRYDTHFVHSIAESVFNYAKHSKHVSVLVPEFDEDLGGGGVLGNMYNVIGRGGTMKSILLQDIATESAIRGIPGIYGNMEMSDNAFFDRTCRKLLKLEFINAVKNGEVNSDMIPEIVEKIDKLLNKKLIVISKNNLSVDDMKDIIKKTEDELGEKLYYFMVDSLNAMAMIDMDENKTAFQNSKNLKEMSKDMNVVTFLINHCRNDCPITMRDNSQYVRGGSKLIDNGDGYFCLSKIVDKEKSNFYLSPPSIVYKPGYVFVRFVNKRESGNTIDKVLYLEDFDIKLSDEDPNQFNV